jgi:hypothetical protein
MATVDQLAERALRRLGVVVVPAANRPSIVATTTIAAVATMALQELGVIASEETPSASDQALMEAKARAVHASLAANTSVNWSEATIPQSVAEEYAKLTAAQAASSFGKAIDPQVVALLEARVRRVASELYAPEMAYNAIMDVHRGLVAMGWAEWTTQDIPDAACEPYVVLACMALAPTFQVQFDPRLGVKAHQDLRRIIALPTSGIPVRAEFF